MAVLAPVIASAASAAATAAPYMAIASAGMSVASGIQQSSAANAQAKFQKQQMDTAARDELLAGTQEEVIRRRELNDTLSTINAMRAGNGLSLSSPTARTIERTNIDNAGRDIGIAKTNAAARSSSYRLQGQAAKIKGNTDSISALMGGFGNSMSILSAYDWKKSGLLDTPMPKK